jgi:hypothetical protein
MASRPEKGRNRMDLVSILLLAVLVGSTLGLIALCERL